MKKLLVPISALLLSGCIYIPPPQTNAELLGTWTESIQGRDQIIVTADSVEFRRDNEKTSKQAIVGHLLDDGVAIPSGAIYGNPEAEITRWSHPRAGMLYVEMEKDSITPCFWRN